MLKYLLKKETPFLTSPKSSIGVPGAIKKKCFGERQLTRRSVLNTMEAVLKDSRTSSRWSEFVLASSCMIFYDWAFFNEARSLFEKNKGECWPQIENSKGRRNSRSEDLSVAEAGRISGGWISF